MIEKTVEIPANNGKIPTFLVTPESNPPHPAIVLYMDVFGIREELKNFCRQLCQAGYSVLLPSLFYRDGNPSFDPASITEEQMQQCHALNNKTTNGIVIQDTGVLLDYLKQDPLTNSQKVGTIGTCMGGRHALLAAAEYPEQVLAFASIHGGRMVTDAEDSPHLAIPQLRANQDETAPQEHLELYQKELKRCGVHHQIDFMEEARHGYIFPERYCYHPQASEKTWAAILKIFDQCLMNPSD